MRNGKYCIAIMTIGSGVGQSVITSCNISKLPITTIGFGMNPFAFGAYECDAMDYVPLIYSENYISELILKCYKYKVDLIIPGSDDEALILSENKKTLEKKGYKVLVSENNFMQLVRDKAKMCDTLSKIADIFVKCYTLEEALSLIQLNKIKFPLIAKPKDGYASRGIEIILNEKDLLRLNSNHIIQELAIPYKKDPFRKIYLDEIKKRKNSQIAEISIQIVTDKTGKVVGKMSSYNKLNNGIPIEIIPYENEYVWETINLLMPKLVEYGFRGPLNIQGRLTDQGLKLFEMNARFTGITGLRAIMGFNEVEYCINDWLEIKSNIPNLEINNDRFGLRQTTNKIVSLEKNNEICDLSFILNKKLLKNTKNILLTGSSGFLAQSIVRLLKNENYNLFALSRNRDIINNLYHDYKNVITCNNEDLFKGKLNLGSIDYIIHCGFARPYRNNVEIIDSLNYTNQIFNLAIIYQIPLLINISSQSVYGGTTLPFLRSECDPILHDTMYALAKYCTELMTNPLKMINKHSKVTSIRLATLSGGLKGLIPVDFLSRFVLKALKNETIEVIGGKQRVQRLDIRDAAEGIVNLLKTNKEDIKPVYNFGPEEDYSVLQIAEMVLEVAKDLFNLEVKINIVPENNPCLLYGIDSTEFYSLVKWKPKYNMKDTIISLFEYLK